MDQRFGIIYKITNKINGKSYIGQTYQNLDRRWQQHYSKCSCVLLFRAIKKYGKENFSVETLGTFLEEFLDLAEIAAIKEHNTLKPNGYNIRLGGGGGGLLTEETKRKISKAHQGERNYWFGKKLSEEHKNNVSRSSFGKKVSEETKRKLSLKNSGSGNPNFGKTHSEEAKLKISKAKKGRKASLETRKKLSESHKGQICPFKGMSHEEYRKKKNQSLLEENLNVPSVEA